VRTKSQIIYITLGAVAGLLIFPDSVFAAQMMIKSMFTMAGSYFGGPIGGAIGGLLGGIVGGLLFPEKGQLIGPKLEDLQVTSHSFGEDIPDTEGTFPVPGLLIDSSDIRAVEHSVGGKGMSASPSGYYYTYSADALWLLRRRQADGILRVWLQGKLRRNMSPDATLAEIIASAAAIKGGRLKFMMGAEDQLPDATFELLHGVGRTPAYRGVVTMAALALELADYANQIPQAVAEVYDDGSEHMRTFGPNQPPFIGSAWVWVGDWNHVDDNHEVLSLVADSEHLAMASATYSNPEAYYWVRHTPVGTFPELKYEKLSDPVEGHIIYPFGGWKSDVPAGIWHSGFGFHFFLYNEWREIFIGVLPGVIGGNGGTWVYKLGRLIMWVPGMGGFPDGAFIDFPSMATDIVFPAPYVAAPKIQVLRMSDNFLYGLYSHGITSLFGAPNSILYKIDPVDFTVLEIWDLGVEKLAGFDLVSDEEMYFTQTGFGSGAPVNFYALENKKAVLIGTSPNPFSVNFINGQLIYKDGIFYYGAPNREFFQVVPAGVSQCVPLSKIVGDACRIAGMEETRFDVSELTDCVDGYGRDAAMTMANWISPLMPHYFFDPVESGGLLKFRKRGRPVAFTIPLTDLAAYEPGEQVPDRLERNQIHERRLPSTVRVQYIQRDKDYERGLQYEEKIITEFRHMIDFSLAESMSDDAAKQMAARLLPVLHFERNEATIRLTRKYIEIEPGDPFEITL